MLYSCGYIVVCSLEINVHEIVILTKMSGLHFFFKLYTSFIIRLCLYRQIILNKATVHSQNSQKETVGIRKSNTIGIVKNNMYLYYICEFHST